MKNCYLFLLLIFSLFTICSCVGDGKTKGPVGGNTTTGITTTPQSISDVNVNLYVENSGSMFGYLSGNSFRDNINYFMNGFYQQNLCADTNIHCFYINNKVCDIPNVQVSNFVTNLKSNVTKCGNQGSTDIALIFDTIFARTDNKTLSVLVSDMILSPDGSNAADYLTNMNIKIMQKIKSKSKDFATVIFHCESSFKGTYYDCDNHTKKIDTIRPYYICVIGNNSLIKRFLSEMPNFPHFNKLNYSVFFSYDSNYKGKYFLVTSDKGNKTTPTSVTNAKLDGNSNKFTMQLGVDFSDLLVDESYLTDVNNYQLSNPNYNLTSIQRKTIGKSTHVLCLETIRPVNKTALTISLKNQAIPDWISNLNNEDCNRIFSDLDKTYGIEKIIDGIYNGYKSDNDYAKMTININ